MPIDASVAMELKKDLQGRRSGYLFETRNGTPLRLSNVLEDKLHPILRKLKLIQPGMGMHAFRHCRIFHLVYSGVLPLRGDRIMELRQLVERRVAP